MAVVAAVAAMAVAAVVADAASCTASGTRVAFQDATYGGALPYQVMYPDQHVGMDASPGPRVDQNMSPPPQRMDPYYHQPQPMPYYPPPPQDDFFDPGYTTVYQLPGYWG